MSKTPMTLCAAEIQQLLEELRSPSMGYRNPFKMDRNLLMGTLMLDTGIRVGELVQLTARHLVFNNEPMQSIVIGPDISKTKTERYVPVSMQLKVAIVHMKHWWDVWKSHYQYIDAFAKNIRGNRMTVRQVERIIGTAAKQSIGRSIHPHQLRHTFATRLMKVTNVRVVQELLGHKHLSSTQIYTHPTLTDRVDAIARMESATQSELST